MAKTHYQTHKTERATYIMCGANHFKNGLNTTNPDEVTCKRCLNLMHKEGLI